MSENDSARLTVRERSIDLPRVHATEGAAGLAVGGLLSETGHVTYDPGYMNTAPTKSAITYIDGDQGILRYRGYSIEDLAEHSTYLETAYLLLNGELPTPGQLERFTSSIEKRTMLDENFKRFFSGFPRDAHPMAVLSSAVSALSTFYQDSLDPFDSEQVRVSTARLLAKVPTIAAYSYRVSEGQPLMYPENRRGLVENFVRLTFGFPSEEYIADPVVVRALEQLFILHADHEQNCSTSAVRLVGSAEANLFASIAAGINALFGPKHGGANQAVMEMLDQLRDSGMSPDDYMQHVKRKENGIRLMGFGHRVYKSYDPRARIVKGIADTILERLGIHDPRLDIGMRLEEIALNDEYFVSRNLYPNVDFYTGIVYKAMGFPTRMFTVLFALGRLPGWIAQWNEMMQDPETKIGRPRQVYVGVPERSYVPLGSRTGTTELSAAAIRAALDADQ